MYLNKFSNKKIKLMITGLSVFVFGLGLVIPVRFAQAACTPIISWFKITPLETSIQKPKVTVSIRLSGLNTCTSAERAEDILYIEADGVGSDVNLPSPLEYLYSNSNDFTLTLPFEDPFTPDGQTERLNWPAITYNAIIAKKGRVTTVGDQVFKYGMPVTIKNLSFLQATGTATTRTTTQTKPDLSYTPPVAKEYDGKNWTQNLTITNNTGVTDIAQLATKLINWLLLVLSLVATVVIIYAGIILVFNGGDEGRVLKAKKTLTWAIAGLVVSIGAFAIVMIIQGIF